MTNPKITKLKPLAVRFDTLAEENEYIVSLEKDNNLKDDQIKCPTHYVSKTKIC